MSYTPSVMEPGYEVVQLRGTKPWYESWTVWINVVTVVGLMGEYLAGRPFTHANPDLYEAVVGVVALANIVLRIVKTDQPVGM